VDWVLLRPLPYPSSGQLVRMWVSEKQDDIPGAVTYSAIRRAAAAPGVRAVVGFSPATRIASADGVDPIHVTVARVTGDLFGVLGVQPRLGRPFLPQETAGGQPVVVLSDAFWRNRLMSDPAVTGRIITIDKVAHTVVGVMPAGRGYPRGADLWRPATADEQEDDDRENVMIARLLAPPNDVVRQQLAGVLKPATADRPSMVIVEPLQDVETGAVRTALLLVLGAAGLVLLVAAANVASLLGARGMDRAGEWAIRGALGAQRSQLVRQLAVECALLAALGGLLGFLLGSWTLELVVRLAPAGLPRVDEIALDTRVALVGTAILLAVAGAVSVMPARVASRVDLRSTLSTDSPRGSGQRIGRRLLVGAQVTMAVVLTVGAVLLTRSLLRLMAVDHGFNPGGVSSINLTLRGTQPDEAVRLFRTLVDTATTVPGVQSAAVSFRLPTDVSGVGLRTKASVEAAREPTTAMLRFVTSAYFETLGLPIQEGRAITATDTRQTPRIAVVNRAFVGAALDGGRAVDRSLTVDVVKDRIVIVGVVADATPGGVPDRPAIYMAYEQFAINAGSLLVRMDRPLADVLPSLLARLRTATPDLAFDRVQTLDETLAAGRAVARFNTLLASAFGLLATVLAIIGVYGLAASEVVSRHREAALRLALGATRAEVLRSLMAPIARILVGALVVGVIGASGLAVSVRASLEGMSPLDPIALVMVPALLLLIGVAAAAAAAWPLVRTDPAATLRT
jgi:putative ABC transport system permease protein